MEFTLEKSLPLLRNTPMVLANMINGLADEWLYTNEGGDTWTVFDVVGHLIHGEKTDWMERMEIIWEREDKHFVSFDRFAQFEESKGKTMTQLLDEFRQARIRNIDLLLSKNVTPENYGRKGIHPVFGEVTLSQLLATWVAHDLDHISQIARIMAKQYKEAVGPWSAYLKIINQQ